MINLVWMRVFPEKKHYAGTQSLVQPATQLSCNYRKAMPEFLLAMLLAYVDANVYPSSSTQVISLTFLCFCSTYFLAENAAFLMSADVVNYLKISLMDYGSSNKFHTEKEFLKKLKERKMNNRYYLSLSVLNIYMSTVNDLLSELRSKFRSKEGHYAKDVTSKW